jgi:CBS domain-containing protein
MVRTALQLMAEKDIGAVPVVDGGELLGMFSERDYARRGVIAGRASPDVPVRELMTTSLFSVGVDQTLDYCMLLMTNKHIRHLPVMEAGQLAGMVSIGDVLKAVIAEQREHLVRLQLYAPSKE